MIAYLKKPTGVVLLALLLILAMIGDFSNGGLMLIGIFPIPAVYTAFGLFYAVLLLFGGLICLLLLYGIWNLKSWARLILLIGFPAQVIFNIILDPLIFENYTILVISLVVAGYLLLPSTSDHFS
ncbi:MAG: hypothetical protein E3J86_12610 [Candidatus Thorarchaeota archaeon]|nr:MAG: hypothetical protein E3J86_12610 [Candidatus Thorarchaeota archaeon]